MISNGNASQQRRKLKAAKIDQRFETVVISSEVGIAKPDAGIFHEACRQMKVNPGDCVMVGDNWERDVLGARSAGMRAIWLCRNREMSADQAWIPSLHELPATLAVSDSSARFFKYDTD
ncbi:MAG: HAD-IA family hydrolase [Chthoniobacteraceae bacterium]